MKVRNITNHAYLDAVRQSGGRYPVYKGRRRVMMQGGSPFGLILNTAKRFLAPLGKRVIKTAKKKILPIIAKKGAQVISGGITPKEALKDIVKGSAKAMLGASRKSLEKELSAGRKRPKRRKQKGRGLMQKKKTRLTRI